MSQQSSFPILGEEDLAQGGPSNVNSGKEKEQDERLKNRCFLLTIFGKNKFDVKQIIDTQLSNIKYYKICGETCPNTGQYHCHVAVYLINPRNIIFWRNLFHKQGTKFHSKYCQARLFANFDRYCNKEDDEPIVYGEYVLRDASNKRNSDTRKRNLEQYRRLAEEGNIEDIPEAEYRIHHRYYDKIKRDGRIAKARRQYEEYMEEKWKERQLRQWQIKLYKLIKEETPDDRVIHWVYDSKGGAGKSDFAKHCELTTDTQVIVPSKSADISYMLTPGKLCYILDIPRTMGEHVPWGFLECLKNGVYMSPKYDSHMVHMRPPHVIVMCNAPPPVVTEKEGFSEDRIVLLTI